MQSPKPEPLFKMPSLGVGGGGGVQQIKPCCRPWEQGQDLPPPPCASRQAKGRKSRTWGRLPCSKRGLSCCSHNSCWQHSSLSRLLFGKKVQRTLNAARQQLRRRGETGWGCEASPALAESGPALGLAASLLPGAGPI